MNTRDVRWLAGLLEGEGSFHSGYAGGYLTTAIHLSMADEDVVRRAAAILGGTVQVDQTTEAKRALGLPRKTVYRTTVSGLHAICWMMTLAVLMGARRRAKIAEAVARWRAYKGNHRQAVRMYERRALN